MQINDEDGSLFGEFISALHGISSLRTLIFVGHTFKSVVLPAAFPESISTLVFDSTNDEWSYWKAARLKNWILRMELPMIFRHLFWRVGMISD